MSKQRRLQNRSRSGSSPPQRSYLRRDEVVRRGHMNQHLTSDELARLNAKSEVGERRDVYGSGPKLVQDDVVLPLEPARIIDPARKKKK